jgi:hypothetical protein
MSHLRFTILATVLWSIALPPAAALALLVYWG